MKKTQIHEVHLREFPEVKFNRQSRLPVEFFRTPGGYYIFDVNQVSFLEVNEVVFKIISMLTQAPKNYHELLKELPGHSPRDIRDALAEIEKIQSQDYLKRTEFQRHIRHELPKIKETLNGNLMNLYFKITTKCNLSCSYCIFSGDYEHHTGLRHQEMNWETVRKAIDFFLARARKKGYLRVDFFGGEPLMAFPLIKRTVDVLKEEIIPRNQELKVSIASNGTIMNDSILDFLIENDVYFQISIDGDKEIHDARRKFKGSDRGSFDTILRSLQSIYDRSPDYYKERLSLKGVLSTEFLDRDDTNFTKLPLIKTVFGQKEFAMLNLRPHFDLEKDKDYFDRIHILGKQLLQKKNVSSKKELLEGFDYKKRCLYFLTFEEFFRFQVTNSLFYEIDQPVPFIRDCLPGYEGCVNPGGSISICYNADTFIIGNVFENTWYDDKIEEFYKTRYRMPGCKHCYIQRFCNFCYEKINGKQEQLSTSIKKYCEFQRYHYRVIFEYMLQVMENNPGLWDELQQQAEKEYEKRLKLQKKEVDKIS